MGVLPGEHPVSSGRCSYRSPYGAAAADGMLQVLCLALCLLSGTARVLRAWAESLGHLMSAWGMCGPSHYLPGLQVMVTRFRRCQSGESVCQGTCSSVGCRKDCLLCWEGTLHHPVQLLWGSALA